MVKLLAPVNPVCRGRRVRGLAQIGPGFGPHTRAAAQTPKRSWEGVLAALGFSLPISHLPRRPEQDSNLRPTP
jgi:hypothetical protein